MVQVVVVMNVSSTTMECLLDEAAIKCAPMTGLIITGSNVQEKDREFLVRVSYFALDNDELIDLLASKNQKLDVQKDVEA